MRHYTKLLPIMLLMAAAFSLRIWHLTLHELSGDEAFTIVTWTPAPLTDLISTVGTIDPQPPIALVSTVLWLHQAGTSEFAARLYSVLSSLIFIAAIFTTTKQLFNVQTALIASLCVTLNPFQLWLSQDVRPYAPWMAASALTTLTLLRSITTNNATSKSLLYHAIASFVALGMFYFQIFNVVANNLIAALSLRRTRPVLMKWAGVQLFLVASFVFFLSLTQLLSGVYRPTASRVDIFDLFPPLLIGTTWPYPSQILAITLTTLPFLLFLLLARRGAAPLYTFILTVTPPVCLAAITLITNQPYFRVRYVSAILAPLSILVAAAIAFIPNQHRLLRAFSLGILLTTSLISILSYHFNPQFAKAPEWRQIMQLLHTNLGTSDLVIQNYPDPAFTYYYNSVADTVVLPASANPAPTTTIQDLRTQLANHRYIWFLPTPTSAWDRDQVVATALQNELPFLNQFWVRNVHILQYAPLTPNSADITHHAIIEYNNILRADGWRLSPQSNTANPSTTIVFEFFYHPTQATSQPLMFFLHLTTTPTSPPATQADHPPQNQILSPTTWHSNQLLRDTFTLQIPPGIPPATYSLLFGIYDTSTNKRLIPSIHPPSPSNDSTLISTITIADN